MNNIIELIGNTPLIRVGEEKGIDIYAKLEYYNPTGSVKDRAALYMIKGAIERGDIKAGGTFIEPTSGNTGIGMALVARQLGYKLILTMPDSMSLERRQLLAALGAEVVLTTGAKGMAGAIERARELQLATPNSYIPMQFDNPDNATAHYEGTAPEIFRQLIPLAIVCGVGSGGTAMGIKNYIIDNNISTHVIAVEPAASPMMTSGVAGGHKIQGIGANFVPKLVDVSKLDGIITITDDEAFTGARALAADSGIMSGISGGAAYMAACKYAAVLSNNIAQGAEVSCSREESNCTENSAAQCVGANVGITSTDKVEQCDNKTKEQGTSVAVVFIVPDNSLKYLSMNIYG